MIENYKSTYLNSRDFAIEVHSDEKLDISRNSNENDELLDGYFDAHEIIVEMGKTWSETQDLFAFEELIKDFALLVRNYELKYSNYAELFDINFPKILVTILSDPNNVTLFGCILWLLGLMLRFFPVEFSRQLLDNYHMFDLLKDIFQIEQIDEFTPYYLNIFGAIALNIDELHDDIFDIFDTNIFEFLLEIPSDEDMNFLERERQTSYLIAQLAYNEHKDPNMDQEFFIWVLKFFCLNYKTMSKSAIENFVLAIVNFKDHEFEEFNFYGSKILNWQVPNIFEGFLANHCNINFTSTMICDIFEFYIHMYKYKPAEMGIDFDVLQSFVLNNDVKIAERAIKLFAKIAKYTGKTNFFFNDGFIETFDHALHIKGYNIKVQTMKMLKMIINDLTGDRVIRFGELIQEYNFIPYFMDLFEEMYEEDVLFSILNIFEQLLFFGNIRNGKDPNHFQPIFQECGVYDRLNTILGSDAEEISNPLKNKILMILQELEHEDPIENNS